MTEAKEKFPEVTPEMKQEVLDKHRELEALSSGHTLRQQRRYGRKPESKWGKNYFKKKAQ